MQDGTALSLDLLGSCVSDQLRPPTLTPHHLTHYLHQGSSAAALKAVTSSPQMPQGQGLPAAPNSVGPESSMASEVAAISGSEQGVDRGLEYGAARGSLRFEASTAQQPLLNSFSGEQVCYCFFPP